MTAPPPRPDSAALRRSAKAQLSSQPATNPPPTVADLQHIQHELEVHQVELKMQNASLLASQAELQAALERYTDFYEFAPVGYLSLKVDGEIRQLNLTAAALLGVKRSLLVKRRLGLFVSVSDRGAFAAFLERVFDGQTQACEVTLEQQAAAPLAIRVNPCKPCLSVRFEAISVPPWQECRVVMTNITERMRGEAERVKLETQNLRLQKSESLSRMAGAIAHTFNNQLQAAMMNLEFALEDLPPTGGLIEPLSAAKDALSKVAEVSTLMLTYAGQTSAERAPMDLSEVCQRSVSLLRAGMPNSLKLEIDLPSPGPSIQANANQIQQVLTNLLANAWEACGDRGGSIHLRVKEVSAAEIPAAHRFPVGSQLQDKTYACVALADTGSGISEQDIEKIFDPFFSTKFTGRGIGLAVVLGILRGHRGVVTVESKAGAGTVFRVFLPISSQAVLPKLIPVAELTKKARSGTVLVVDDEPMVCIAVASVLRHAGFTVLTARDGVEAVEVFRAQQAEIRLVLCDLTMPRMGGWETLEALRKLAPGIPVILASGYSEAQVLAGAHAELPQAILGKPYAIATLMSAFSEALKQVNP